ncbi:helix-turn-helix domain-containing protein [Streptomyces sp. NPDC001002]
MDVVSTADVSPGEAFDFWREVSSRLWVPYDLRCDPQVETGFRAQVGVCDVGSVQTTLMTTAAHGVHRTPKLIRRTDPEVLKVGCILRGRGRITQAQRCAEFGVGDLILFDPSRPYVSEFAPDVPGSQQLLLLRFPRSLLALRDQDVQRLSAVRIPGDQGIGALSSQFLRQLARQLSGLSPAQTSRLSTLTLDVLSTALADALDAPRTVAPHTRQRALTARIHVFVQDNLGDPHLTPDAIAAAHHISLRYLHRLFQHEGQTVAGWIRGRRLEQCRRDLADVQLASRPIQAIAARWGFSSPAHFSQTFRNAYGLTPREYRRQHGTVHPG